MLGFLGIFGDIAATFSGQSNLLFTLLFFTGLIVVYAVFVYFFYRYLAKKNLIGINLSKYNNSEHAVTLKFLAIVFYIVEYLVILPVLTFFWFAVLSILVLIMAESLSVSSVLLISAALVASVRITSYVSSKLSQDLAKMLPFTLLAIALTNPAFFEVSSLLMRFKEIPLLFSNFTYYLGFIVIVELVMRVGEFMYRLTQSNEEQTKALKA